MAKLILTEEEKQTIGYLDHWSDDSLGKLLKQVSLSLIKTSNEMDKIITASATLFLIGVCVEANAATLEIKVSESQINNVNEGDWLITIQKLK